MAWETRKRGGRYYTRSRKVGGRVVREYVGSGLAGKLAAEYDRVEHDEKQKQQDTLKAEMEQDRAQEKTLLDYSRSIDSILAESLQKAGFHKHKGQWRRKRGKKED